MPFKTFSITLCLFSVFLGGIFIVWIRASSVFTPLPRLVIELNLALRKMNCGLSELI